MLIAFHIPGERVKCDSMIAESEAGTRLSQDQVARFHEAGFLTLREISPAEEVASLRETFRRLFDQRAGREEGAQFDMVGHDEDGAPPKLSQIIKPANFAPELLRTQFRANALAIARQLLGPSAVEVSDHAILKPAGYGAPTPWHQDEAFREAGFAYQQISVWMPLQEATPENGCMQYIPGTNRGELLEHRSPNNDPRVHALECSGDFDPEEAVLCPLPPGGAVIHHGRTLHYAGPNQSTVSRYAYVLMYETPPAPVAEARDHAWNRNKQTASLSRRARWRRRGGAFVVIWRKLRMSLGNDPRLLFFEVRRLFFLFCKRLKGG